MSNARVTAVWAVHAGTSAKGEINPDGLTADQLADLVDQIHPGISLCHQCAYEIDDPEVGELVAFIVDDRRYERSEDGQWREAATP